MMNKAQLIILFVLFFCASTNAQSSKEIAGFKNKVAENSKLFEANINKSYHDLDGLIKESRKLKDSLSEMKLLEKKCRYFYNKNQIDSLFTASEQLQKVSENYGNTYNSTMADIYLAHTYSVNKLYDKAIIHLNHAYDALQNNRPATKDIFYAKANILSSFANVYMDKKEPRNAVRKLREQIRNSDELKDHRELARFKYLNYSNIANVYLQYNIDSAYYFARKAIEIKPKEIQEDGSMSDNYIVIGKYYQYLKDDENAVKNFHRALKIGNHIGVELNINDIYKSLKEIYLRKNNKDSADFYENKIKQYNLQVLQSKYNSLQKVISKDEEEKSRSSNRLFLFLGISLVIVSGISTFLFLKFRKKKNIKIEETMQMKTEPHANTNLHEAYKNLISLLENNDSGFMFAFESLFPGFSEKLLKIKPDLQQSEIEFCALLKLKLTTKEIAKYTFIETRTVQNKKYRIRKKFEIHQQTDIYHWIDSI
ncbi:LuxR C-terminal-related transcriptional regulator [Chryseobacterium sp. SSA4.19]|uniref:tetratricopeptide repeat protein n=1 Tax=Chryseobacterium sp. SSA4.19 TaxID=2919915 RepID=UPI001F4DFED2|nr:LuxR C-terminal-related transcriptional regulator [Chryseobacterium sp. SSA4.19]MCJ8154387.1 LuxR C-terminal-related transcriptional regulator [Chryseobacterium sp. SSA4.19]